MKSKIKIRKMNPFREKYEQLTLIQENGLENWFDCPTGEWKKGYVQFIADHDGISDIYRIIIGDKALDWDDCSILKSDQGHWQGLFERAGFKVRYTKK
jgi:hypothetical protein